MNTQIDRGQNTLTLRVPGDLVSTNAEALRMELASQLESAEAGRQNWDTFVVDLTAAAMVDSVGLNLLVSWLRWVRERGGKMKVVFSNPNVLRTFRFTRLDKHIELVKV